MKNLKDLIETIQDVPSWKDVVSELKEVDTLLTEISKTEEAPPTIYPVFRKHLLPVLKMSKESPNCPWLPRMQAI